ncbi:hypothetical protein JR316_0012289 [Psilocybe cubensis]|uniref:Uncharacterized protein n=2 Tax=Psilocybe cubensis TaxID=181762 RepID=A0ACB8GHT2_PSICU|nr:hypothetical protein JR316_0012289 [Psilocybe cubensis]KAH9475178.1 hypothetical protein JR316_0012289 [Psilocybe cubensis]
MDDYTSRLPPVTLEVPASKESNQVGLQQNQASTSPPQPVTEIQPSSTGVLETTANPSNFNNAEPPLPPSSILSPRPSPIPPAETHLEVPRFTQSPVSFAHDRDANSGGSRSTEQDLPPVPEKIVPLGDNHPDPRAAPLSTRRLSRPLSEDVDTRRLTRSSFNTQSAPRIKTAGERLEPTLVSARVAQEKYTAKAKVTGFLLNAAIGLQVLLGGISTLVASYLARTRGSNEPELSIARVKDLDHFIRECEAFQMDHGHKSDSDLDARIDDLRRKFEDLLGNGNGERKLSSV